MRRVSGDKYKIYGSHSTVGGLWQGGVVEGLVVMMLALFRRGVRLVNPSPLHAVDQDCVNWLYRARHIENRIHTWSVIIIT